jgi:MFS transporter, MHS family, shikimate and dehydroshikimate transport protein
VILASAIGSALEWYDFFLYGTAAAFVFGEDPGFDPLVGVLLSFASFGVGFVARHERQELCPDLATDIAVEGY